MASIKESPCPCCGAPPGTLHLDRVLQAEPVGSFSLAGVMPKFPARSRPRLTCSACGLDLLGEYIDAGRNVTFPLPEPKATPT